jgi:hypothetical protein
MDAATPKTLVACIASHGGLYDQMKHVLSDHVAACGPGIDVVYLYGTDGGTDANPPACTDGGTDGGADNPPACPPIPPSGGDMICP